MKVLLLSILMAFAGTSAQTTQLVSGTVEGTVKRTDNGEPIADVQVTMTVVENLPQAKLDLLSEFPQGTQMKPALVDAAPVPYFSPGLISATSDASGHFIFRNVPAGTWSIRARRDGYMAPTEAGSLSIADIMTTPIHAEGGNFPREISLTLAPAGTITGRVRDPNGNPVSGIIVAAYQYTYVNGGRALLNSRAAKRTDDHGDFRLFWLAPGEYIIAVTPTAPGTEITGKDIYPKTFSPGTFDAGAARRIIVREGETVERQDINLRVRSTVKVSGRLVISVPSPDPRPSFYYLVPRDPKDYPETGPFQFQNIAADQSNGQFEIRNVPPGHYDLIAAVSNMKGGKTPGRTPIDVGNFELKGITVSIHPGVDVTAHLTYVGGIPDSSKPAPRIQMRAWENYSPIFDPQNTRDALYVPEVDAFGVTKFPDKAEARYRFQVSGLPPTAYLTDVREGGVSIFDTGLHVGLLPPREIEVVVNLTDTTVEGNVSDTAQNPVHLAKVVLVPQETRRGNLDLYRTVSTNASGRFVLHGVVPGTYKILAWQHAPSDYAWENSDFIAKYEEHGQTVTVTPIGVADLQLQAIP